MRGLLFIIGIFSLAFVGCKREQPPPQLQIYFAQKEARSGLHEANFSAFPKLGYIADKPDLVISKLEGVSFGPSRAIPGSAQAPSTPVPDRTTLVLKLTSEDAATLKELTSKHIGDRLLVLLNDDPLFAPEIRTPSAGQEVYITPPPGTDNGNTKTLLETLVQPSK